MTDPKREFAVDVVRRLDNAGYQALWAGGCVRDSLLGRTPKDFDVATNATPEEVRRVFGRRRTLAVGESFGVIIVLGPQTADQVEVATFRTDGDYHDGRRPAQVRFSTAEADARRRDFTINGMFYDPLHDRVLDFVGGQQDLQAGVVRAIGDPRERMREDKLRLLRAVRFAETLEFQLDPATAEAVRELAGELTVVSAERIAQELKQMLEHPRRARAMQLAGELGLLRAILPELFAADEEKTEPPAWGATLQTLEGLCGAASPVKVETALAALLRFPTSDREPANDADAAREICNRLRLSNVESTRICWLVEHRDGLDDAPQWPHSRLKRHAAHPGFVELLALARAEKLAAAGDLHAVEFCEQFLRDTPPEQINPSALISGDDLIAIGLRPGPQFKVVIESVRDAQLNGAINTPAEALEFAIQQFQDGGAP